MNAPDKNPPATLSDGVVDWLTNGTRDERFIDNILRRCVSASSRPAFR